MNQSAPIRAAQVADIAYCYILPTICILGIIGNITNLVVLASRKLRAVSYMYLRALAVADLLCMLFVLIFVSVEILEKQGIHFNRSRIYAFYQAHLMLTLINWALGTGVFVVMALSLERFISIVFPLQFRAWNSPQRAINAIILSYVIPVLLYIPYGISRYKSEEHWDPINNVTYWKVADSEISQSMGWQFYKWTREAMLRFGPIIVLSILNVRIMVAFRNRQRMFAQLTKRNEKNASHRNSNKDDTLLYMLGGTVIMFFICNIPAAINLILIDEDLKRRWDYQIFRAAANLLEIMNHASQFYVFCACSTDYRVTFLQKFPCFQKSYANKRMRSFVKRTQSVINRDRESEPCDTQRAEDTPSHSKTSRLDGHRDQDTVDLHLASGESDGLSGERESDSLIRYGVVAKLKMSNDDLAGSTFL
ncbi:unnamed protein product, partial [Mesorhabditis belari]|uniref:G-protein coupled receptors family 1 profile domain-containing protein n=1 Tax=Mesorhabditis belari TaxID=2138241 RepID=A0AAF3FL47_9BILA